MEIRPVSPGAAAREVPRLPRAGGHRRPAPQRQLLRRALPAHVREQVDEGDRRVRHAARRASASSSRCRAARTRWRCGTSCSSSATRPTGSTSGSASASTATSRAPTPAAFARRAGCAARGRPAARSYGFDVPTAAAATPPRAVLGVRAVEAPPVRRRRASTAATTWSPPATTSTTRRRCSSATCCGGTTEYLGRQLPCCPARAGFPRKVKPLVRLGERETAAYCVLRGIDYMVEECPMAAGNKHLGYKEALNAIEAESPGSKHAVLLRVPRAGVGRCSHRGRRRRRRPRRGATAAVRRRPATSAPSAGSPSGSARGPTGEPPVRANTDERAALRAGEKVLLSTRRTALPRAAGRRRRVPLPRRLRAARRAHRPARGRHRAGRRTAPGTRAVRPTLADFVLKMPRGAQVIYPKDLGPHPAARRRLPGRPHARVGRRARARCR